ncbi:MAG: BLUF domain-containing protein [Acidisphaera sp.]|nr:BLUF domain-containing protein [Acidisphaera sp.]
MAGGTHARTHRIVYCSRNALRGSHDAIEAEIRQILEKSRANNHRDGITGALLFSSGSFVQVLEGPIAALERTFETIQRDPRHRDVTVLQIAESNRGFPAWSMAFAGNTAGGSCPAAEAAMSAALADPSAASGEQLLSVLRTLVVREDDWALAS